MCTYVYNINARVRQQLGWIFGNLVEVFYGVDSALGAATRGYLATGTLQVRGELATPTMYRGSILVAS